MIAPHESGTTSLKVVAVRQIFWAVIGKKSGEVVIWQFLDGPSIMCIVILELSDLSLVVRSIQFSLDVFKYIRLLPFCGFDL